MLLKTVKNASHKKILYIFLITILSLFGVPRKLHEDTFMQEILRLYNHRNGKFSENSEDKIQKRGRVSCRTEYYIFWCLDVCMCT